MAEWFTLIVILVAGVLNFILTACELALVAFHYGSKMEDNASLSTHMKSLYYRADSVGRTLSMCANLCILALGAAFFAIWRALLADSGTGIFWQFLFAFFSAWFFQHLTGYVLPRAYSLRNPDTVIRRTCRFLLILDRIVGPLMSLGDVIERKISKTSRREGVVNIQELGMEAQVQAISQEDEEPTPITKKIIRNALKMSSLEISDVLLPRHQVQIMDLNESLTENLTKARKTGHTRFPLCRGGMDDCSGLVHIKDLFRLDPLDAANVELNKIRRNIGSLSLDEPLELAMEHMLRKQTHMALVVDEFGGVVGVLTLESILEELVGDIQDEFDVEEAQILPVGKGEFWVSGLAPVHDVEEALGVDIDNEEVSTIGGLITALLGRFPKTHETMKLDKPEIFIKVEEVDARRIIAVRMKVLDGTPD